MVVAIKDVSYTNPNTQRPNNANGNGPSDGFGYDGASIASSMGLGFISSFLGSTSGSNSGSTSSNTSGGTNNSNGGGGGGGSYSDGGGGGGGGGARGDVTSLCGPPTINSTSRGNKRRRPGRVVWHVCEFESGRIEAIQLRSAKGPGNPRVGLG